MRRIIIIVKMFTVFKSFPVLSMILLILMPVCSSADDVFNVTYIAPGYTAIEFVTLSVNTAAVEFDEEGNIYTSNGEFEFNLGTRQVTIWKYFAESGYTEFEEYVSYYIEAAGINGLAFDNSGNLFVTEFDEALPGYSPIDSGYIRKIDSFRNVGNPVSTSDVDDNGDLFAIRPTGVIAIGDGHLYFPGRKWSDPGFGNLYEILSFDKYSPPPGIIREDVVLTALTEDESGKLYSGTLDNSIYTRDPVTNRSIKIASFNQHVEALKFWRGDIYALEGRDGPFDKASIIRISSFGIDIKPGSSLNLFNQNEHGIIPVAIFGSPNLDVTKIDVESLSLQGLGVSVLGRSDKYHTDYVNGDAYIDLVVQFKDSDGLLNPGNGYVLLHGYYNGSHFWAGDTICIVSPEAE